MPADAVSDPQKIGFRNAHFTWSSDVNGSLTPSKRRFTLRIEGELLFKPKCVNLVIGETGSGKTSLLMALLCKFQHSKQRNLTNNGYRYIAEMHFVPFGPDSWYNLPREGGIAYAAQESWVQNETIRVSLSPPLQMQAEVKRTQITLGKHCFWLTVRPRPVQQGSLPMWPRTRHWFI